MYSWCYSEFPEYLKAESLLSFKRQSPQPLPDRLSICETRFGPAWAFVREVTVLKDNCLTLRQNSMETDLDLSSNGPRIAKFPVRFLFKAQEPSSSARKRASFNAFKDLREAESATFRTNAPAGLDLSIA